MTVLEIYAWANHGPLRGSLKHVGELLGEARTPTAQPAAPPSIAPSSRPVAGDVRPRADGWPAATAAAAPPRLAAWLRRSSNVSGSDELFIGK